MRILVNCLNLNKGGGVQVASSIVANFIKDNSHDYFFVLSERVYLECSHVITNEVKYCLYKLSGYSRLYQILEARRILRKHEYSFDPDAVLTVFGPVLWRPKSYHLMGYAIPHFIYSEISPFFERLGRIDRLKFRLLKYIQLGMFKFSADDFYTETESASYEFSKVIGRDVYTVSNSLNEIFFRVQPESKIVREDKVVLVVASYYQHKNLEVLRAVADIVQKRGVSVRFEFTIENSQWEELGEHQLFYNHGNLKLDELCVAYQNADIFLLPTLLECFSASYLEASYFELPILTSDLPFARTVCGDSAIYFDPQDPNDIAMKLENLIDSEDLLGNYKSKSSTIWRKFPSSHERATDLISIMLKNSDKNV